MILTSAIKFYFTKKKSIYDKYEEVWHFDIVKTDY